MQTCMRLSSRCGELTTYSFLEICRPRIDDDGEIVTISPLTGDRPSCSGNCGRKRSVVRGRMCTFVTFSYYDYETIDIAMLGSPAKACTPVTADAAYTRHMEMTRKLLSRRHCFVAYSIRRVRASLEGLSQKIGRAINPKSLTTEANGESSLMGPVTPGVQARSAMLFGIYTAICT